MGKRQREQVRKFKIITNWICNDLYRSTFNAQANFLVAQGLLNYTEVMGSFLIGEYVKDQSGKIKVDRHGTPLTTTSAQRFNAFFDYLGTPYKKLTKKNLNLYDELRCGLTHEYLVKKRRFCIYGADRPYTEREMDNLIDPANNNSPAVCGVIFRKDGPRSGSWHILNPKYYIDFKRAVDRLIVEVESGKNKSLNKNFFERCKKINLINFS